MTSEGGEYGSERRDEDREYDEGEDLQREVRELIDEAERERSDETIEKQECSEDDEYEREVQDLIDEAQEERRNELTKAEEEQEQYWSEATEDCIQEVLQDIEREEEVERKTWEEAEEDFEREAREVSDQPDESDYKEFDPFEKNDLDNERSMEEDLGYDLDEVRDDLHDSFVNDMERQLEGASTKDVESEEIGSEGSSSEMIESSQSYHDAGSDMVYATETRSVSECETQSEDESKEVSENQEPTETEESIDDADKFLESKTRNTITKSDLEDNESHRSYPGQELESPSLSKPESEEAREEPYTEPSEEDSSELEVTKVEDSETNSYESKIDETAFEPESTSEDDTQQTEMESRVPEYEAEIGENSDDEEMIENQKDMREYGDILQEVNEEEDTLEAITADDESREIEDQEISSDTDEHAEPAKMDWESFEELLDRVEELLEAYENSVEDSDERVIVEALTGEEIPDRTLESRSFFGESKEDEEEEEVRERLRELFDELTEEERERFKEMVRARLKTEDDLYALIKKHSSVRYSADFKQKLDDACSYLKSTRAGAVPRLIPELWALEVEREWMTTVGVVSRRRMRKEMDTKLKESQFSWTQQRLDVLLAEHEGLKKNARFKERYRNAISWILLMKRLQDGHVEHEPSPEILKNLSREFMISIANLRMWLKGKAKPMLIVQLERKLGLRSSPGGRQYALAMLQSQTNEIEITKYLTYLQTKGPLGTRVQSFLHAIMNNIAEGVWFTEVSSEFSDVLQYISDNEDMIERELTKGSLEVKVKVLGNKLYIRNRSRDPFSWTDLLKDESFYLDRKWKRNTLGKVMGRLNLRNLKELSELIRGLTDYGWNTHIPVGGLNADLQNRPNHLQSQSLEFVLDVMGWSIGNIRDQVISIGQSWKGQWQIRNPLFPEELELQEILARLFAIIASDGHIDRNSYSLSYTEERPERRMRVKEILTQIGDVWILDIHDPNRGDSMQLPSVLGRLMYRLGIPLGDKVIQGFGIPQFILDGTPGIQAAYLEELIPEEGSITYNVYGGLKILWGRTVVLHEGRESKSYTSPMQLNEEIIDFIRTNGKYEKKRQCYRLSAGELRRKRKSKETDVARIANELDRIAKSNPSTLQNAEQELCSKLGIKTGRHLCYIRFYTKSGRVSAHWEAHTSSQKDVEKWWKIAPPNDERKRARLKEFFSNKKIR